MIYRPGTAVPGRLCYLRRDCPLSHGIRRASSPGGGAKDHGFFGFAQDDTPASVLPKGGAKVFVGDS